MGFVANDSMIGEALAEAKAVAGRWQLWLGLLGAAVVIGLTGPFGTYTSMPVPSRLAYWSFVVITTFWIGFLPSFAVATWAEGLGLDPPWSIGLGGLAASFPVILWLAALHWAVLAEPFRDEALRLLPYILVIAPVVSLLFEAVEARKDMAALPTAAPSEPSWLDRLPPDLGRDLLLLQAQDHYLRAQTPLGETLLRGSIGEATEELGDYGVRVHRSWWVSRSAIQSYRYLKGAPMVVLTTGQEIPVGRSFRRRLLDVIS